MNTNTVRQLQSAIHYLSYSDGDVATSSGCACDQPDGQSTSLFQQKKDLQIITLEQALQHELNTLV